MVHLRVDTKSAMRGLTEMERRQVPFALALALNDTAQDVKEAQEQQLVRALDRPTPFTKKAIFVRRASKARPQAKVGVKDIQLGYLGLQYRGGLRRPKGQAFLVPKGQRVNQYGNMARGAVRRALQKKNVFVASKKQGKRKQHLPGGIYQRGRGKQKGKLKLLVAFEDRAQYRQRLDFEGVAVRVVRAGFGRHMQKRFAQAMETAR